MTKDEGQITKDGGKSFLEEGGDERSEEPEGVIEYKWFKDKGQMTKEKKFENLDVWKLSRILVKDLSILFYDKSFRNFSFQDQIMRAAISISNNIAEGFERNGDKEFVRFLIISKGSCGEVRSLLYNAIDLSYIDKEQFQNFYNQCDILSRKLSAFINYLKKA